ncbi:MAG: hypothetical protein EBU34_07510 [Alphaproteobacteria bacterium]|nr:hypothetical protein [Alphaproteobacteria bacterium]
MKVALAMGDPAGIGPELLVRAVASERMRSLCEMKLFGDIRTLHRAARSCSLEPPNCKMVHSRYSKIDMHVDSAKDFHRWGENSAWAGQVQVESLLDALKAARAGDVDAVVFAPFNKHSLTMACIDGDESTVIRDFFKVNEVRTVTRWNKLMRSTVVGHVPFVRIAENISPAAIVSAIGRLQRMLSRYGIATPRIGVAALNPHAGDGGTLGDEEISFIRPTLEKYSRETGTQIRGPYPADILMPAALRGDLDGIVYLYHDQGNIALKAVSFGREVVFYADLPIVISTVAHGTAYDIAGQGIADPQNFEEAVVQTVQLVSLGSGRT